MSLAPSYTFSGRGDWSLDGAPGTGGLLQLDVPPGSTVVKTFLYYTTYSPAGVTSVLLAGQTITNFVFVGQTGGTGFALATYRADVTDLVAAFVGNGSSSLFNMAVRTGAATSPGSVDGFALAVVYANPAEQERTIVLSDGFSDPAGDQLTINFAAPLDTTAPGFEAILSLGIDFSAQNTSSSNSQVSRVDVNGVRLTSSAGGQDDGALANGALITIGGVGDSPDRPADPNSSGTSTRYDDELYDVTSLLTQGSTSARINTFNPSNDDNIFFVGINITAAATVVAGIDDRPAIADTAATLETEIVMGNVVTNDIDPNGGPPAMVTAINGSTTGVGTDVTLASGAIVRLNADGSYSYNPNGKFEYLAGPDSGASNRTATDSFAYTLSSGASTTVTITITGVDNNDRINGSVGNDNLRGGGANDRFVADAGNDLHDGGDGTDTADYSATTQGVIVKLVEIDRAGASDVAAILTGAGMAATTLVGVARGAEVGTDSLRNMENAIGGSGNDNIAGNAGANLLNGGGGNDILSGDAGNDMLLGGSGDDRFFGGTGDDFIDGEAGIDTVDYAASTQGVIVKLTEFDRSGATGIAATLAANGLATTTAVGVARGADIGEDVLRGIENIFGGSGNDNLAGNNNANLIVGGAGNDLMYGVGGDDLFVGGAGNDLLDGGDGIDTADYSATTQGVMVSILEPDTFGATDVVDALSGVQQPTNALVGISGGVEVGSDELRSIENIIGGSGNDIISGNAGRNLLVGNAGNDKLLGGGGADRIEGGSGADQFIYRNASDSTDSGYDTLVGFSFQDDRIDLPGAAALYHYDATLTGGSLSSATLGADLTALLDGVLTAKGIAFVTADQGTLAGQSFMVADLNGIAGYQAGQDLLIGFDVPVTPPTDLGYLI